MFKSLILAAGVALALFVSVGSVSADRNYEQLYGASLCEDGINTTNIYYSVGFMAYVNDLCNKFEIKQANLLNDVIVDYFVQHSVFPLGPNLHPSSNPCAKNSNAGGAEYAIGEFVQTNFWLNNGGLSVGAPGVHNVWYNSDGPTCLIGSEARALSNPIARIEAHSGLSFEDVFNAYVASGKAVESTRQFLVDSDGNEGCIPVAAMFNGVVTRAAEACVVATESSFDYDPEFVAKRYK